MAKKAMRDGSEGREQIGRTRRSEMIAITLPSAFSTSDFLSICFFHLERESIGV